MAMNSQVNDSVGYSPFEMLFAQKMEMPLETDLDLVDDSLCFKNTVEHMRENLKIVPELANLNQSKGQEPSESDLR